MNKNQGEEKNKIVLFSLDEPRYALYLSSVESVIHAVEITPLPKAPEIVLGIINLHGAVIPVIDIRKRFNLPSHEISLDDQFIIAKTTKRTVAMVVDSVAGVSEIPQSKITYADENLPYTAYLAGVAVFEGNLILINDLEKFLSLDEEKALENAINDSDK